MDPAETLDQIRRLVGPMQLDIAVHVDGALTLRDEAPAQIAQLEDLRTRLKTSRDALRAVLVTPPIS